MSSENWSTNQDPQYVGRSYNNNGGGNYRGGQRREGGTGGPGGGGYQGNRPYSGGYGGQRSYGQNGGNGTTGGRQYYDRQPRQSYNGGGQPRNGGGGGGFNSFAQGGASDIIEVSTNKVGMIIGRGGGKIREIQQNFNVHVKIDRDPGVNGFTGVTIRGEEASIAQAKNFIEDLVAVK